MGAVPKAGNGVKKVFSEDEDPFTQGGLVAGHHTFANPQNLLIPTSKRESKED